VLTHEEYHFYKILSTANINIEKNLKYPLDPNLTLGSILSHEEVVNVKKSKAISEEHMTVGALAKKMGITVRTLHHYDKMGLLSPSTESEGGYRLYSYKDMVKLNQILSMKYLGFSLDDIKNRLVSLDTPESVADALTEHAAAIRSKVEALAESLQAIEALRQEVIQMHSVDFKKYADIIASLQMKNENYWAIKYFDDDMLDHIRRNFVNDKAHALEIMQTMSRLNTEAVQLEQDGVSPESERGQIFAKEFWEMIMEFTGGDLSLLPKLVEITEKMNELDEEKTKGIKAANHFTELALSAYFAKLNYDPFKMEEENK